MYVCMYIRMYFKLLARDRYVFPSATVAIPNPTSAYVQLSHGTTTPHGFQKTVRTKAVHRTRPLGSRLTCPPRLTDVCNRGKEHRQNRESDHDMLWDRMARVHPVVVDYRAQLPSNHPVGSTRMDLPGWAAWVMGGAGIPVFEKT
ncbi:hypothetical protein BO94DRAFT_239315 [Aspergillus sclerotioniger CBS 115572]|uniref:Uncharacterized protein n=1 Tax=Aspergillus sclerotioniger CBS 115572 TaxID=1450535 RepID=A0A317VFC7_9EURO|nr:hypothetical protein BO94DRAFT_239315 [Aspergillus sclerotioniger CBS 115572]PWY73086.1 hypothetical protein BO94DRAFT_239315 [Aspergillus sclerotioniger CBS 115572]